MAETGLVRLKYTHEAMVDLMIANPCVTVRELSLRFGVTEQWIYKIRASGVFREKLHQRAKELVDPAIAAEIEERFDALMNRSLEVLMDHMAKESKDIPFEAALQAAQLGAKAMALGGFGAKAAPTPAPPDPDRLERLAARLERLNQPQGVIDVQAREVSVPSEARAA